MFDVHGDEITYRGISFATIDGRAWPSLKAEATSELIHGPDGWVSEADHWGAVEEAEAHGERAGRDEARDNQRTMITCLEDALATLEANGDPDDDALIGQIVAVLKEAKAE